MEDIITEWVQYMPVEIRICSSYKNPEGCKKAIDKTTDATLLLGFAQFHAYLVSMYYVLLRPSPSEDSRNEQLLTYVQHHSLEQALQCCGLLLYSVRRLSDISGDGQCKLFIFQCR